MTTCFTLQIAPHGIIAARIATAGHAAVATMHRCILKDGRPDRMSRLGA